MKILFRWVLGQRSNQLNYVFSLLFYRHRFLTVTGNPRIYWLSSRSIGIENCAAGKHTNPEQLSLPRE
jgi:hypothetical protein